jgi:transcription elongation GreA/GreB family factor
MMDLTGLRMRRGELQRSYERAVKTSQEADGRMQSRYDTQKEEWAREAEMLHEQIIRLDEQIAYLSQLLSPSQYEEVEIGHVVTLQVNGDDSENFLLVEGLGGTQIGEIQTLSNSSPIGKAILGKCVGDKVTVNLGGGSLEVYIQAIQAIEEN